MKVLDTGFEGLKLIEPVVYEDERGSFFESFNQLKAADHRFFHEFVQDNESCSKKGVLRGFHYQNAPFAQAKLVRVIKGSVQDVVIELRESSESFGKAYHTVLSGENKKQLLIPRGFAHAFLSLEDETIFSYKCDNYYSKEHECGINPLQQSIFQDWVLNKEEFILSDKDQLLSNFEEASKF